MTTWQAIDFHGIVTLDPKIVVELNDYLEKKETWLAHVILDSIHPTGGQRLSPLLQPPSIGSFTLSQAVKKLENRIKECSDSHLFKIQSDDWRTVVELVEQGLWDYVELLEGMAAEFFQQLDQVGFEQWGEGLLKVVEAIKGLLLQKLQEVNNVIDPLEEQLKAYRSLCGSQQNFVEKVKGFFKNTLLTKDLKKNIVKTEKFVGFRYQTFTHRVTQHDLLYESTKQFVQKFEGYHVFNQLDRSQRETFIQLYQWMRIWELNQTAKSLPDREPVRAIRQLWAPEKVLHFFKDYEKALRHALFQRSRQIKLLPNSLVDLVGRIQHQHALQGQVVEVHTLGTVVRKYRDFLLRTDPNPYIRSRLGFGEWIVGPEPAIAKNLMELIYDIEGLDELFEKLIKSTEEEKLSPIESEKIKLEVQRILHEMAQPLASYSLMRLKGRLFIQALQRMNELGSTDATIVGFVGDALSRALRSDWKFHVLHENQDFHQLYSIHQGIVGRIEDRIHLNRMERFKKIIVKIRNWVKNNDSHRHLDEIEADISDLKGYLQDLLASIQRFAKDAAEAEIPFDLELTQQLSHQLLECRYLFGQFFHDLRRDKGEERVIRNQFLFVDQYFESIENKLHEIKD